MEIKKIWFDDNRIYGLTDDDRILWQSLLYYPRLLGATESQRQQYAIGFFGIHWSEIDEDISFESFEYNNPEPSDLSKLLLSLPELNLSTLARRLDMPYSLLIAYKYGIEAPSQDREGAIRQEIHKIGCQFQSVCNL